MKVNQIPAKIPDILLAELIAFSLAYAFESVLALNSSLAYMALYICIIVLMLCIMFLNKMTTVVSFSLIGTAVLTFTVFILLKYGSDTVLTFLDDYFYWLRQYMMYHDISDALFQSITMIAICVAVSVFSYCFIARNFKFIVVLIFGMAVFVVQWVYNLTYGLTPFYLFLAAILIAYIKHIYNVKSSGEPNEYAGNVQMVIWSLPVCMITVALSFSIKASDMPIQWEWLDKKIVSAYNYLVKNFDYESFDYFSLSASSGFGEGNDILGGRVRLDRTNVLRVTTGKRIYLKGASRDEYTGKNWTGGIYNFIPAGNNYGNVYDDYLEMKHCMKILAGNDKFFEEYFDSNPVTVTFLNLWTKSVFIPSGIYEFKPESSGFFGFVSDTGDLSSEKRLSKGFSYTLKMYSPKLGDEGFEDLLRKSKRGLYKEYLDELDVSSIDEANEYYEISKYKEKSEQIYERYMKLPDNLPQRVKDLSLSLTSSKENNYDKAKAIEQYLASSYPYNLDVRSTPRNRDFVDYFLFDLKEGYCSYYASAMTILARCAGLPARYVEGYMLPPDPLKDDRTAYIISNMQAHAWVEIYFEGYGWLPFEPTSPFRPRFYTTVPSGTYFSNIYNSAYADYMEMMMRYAYQGGYYHNIDEITTKDGPSVKFLVLIGFGIFMLLFLALLLANIIKNKLRLYKLLNLPIKECIIKLYEYYVKILGLDGHRYLPAETPFQFSEKIDSRIYFGPIRFKAVTDVFIKARYSRHEPSENEKQLIGGFYPEFHRAMKADMGKFKYFTLKYILGKI
jgi:transglutaminase-like putative cysteine protease